MAHGQEALTARARLRVRWSDGVELPVLDLTDPAYDLEPAGDLPTLVENSLERMERMARLPRPVRSVFGRYLRAHSVLLGGRDGRSMSGLTTYLNKLGPGNLPAGLARRFDDDVARLVPSVAIRLRLRSVARFLADHLLAMLAPGTADLRLVNLAGGTAADSLNALVLLHAERPDLLDGRAVTVHVLDADAAGPRFAGECAGALTGPEGPLAGHAVTVRPARYDWSDTRTLAAALPSRLLGGSSEGGLFEYATDDEVVANLRVLRAAVPAEFALVGSLWQDNRLTRAMRAANPLGFVLRDLGDFAALVAGAGWAVERTANGNPAYTVVSLRPV